VNPIVGVCTIGSVGLAKAGKVCTCWLAQEAKLKTIKIQIHLIIALDNILTASIFSKWVA
jgi:hypothetical protein